MKDKPDAVLRDELDNARRLVAESRSSLTTKLGELDDRVQETVADVKHVFDFDYQMQQRPWVLVGGSVLVGYTLARLVSAPRTTTIPNSSDFYSQTQQRSVNESRIPTSNSSASIRGEVLDVVKGTLWAMARQALRVS